MSILRRAAWLRPSDIESLSKSKDSMREVTEASSDSRAPTFSIPSSGTPNLIGSKPCICLEKAVADHPLISRDGEVN